MYSEGYRRLEYARVERNKFVTRGAAAHVALVDCFRERLEGHLEAPHLMQEAIRGNQ